MRGLRESLRLLARSNALLASLSPAAASGGGALAAAAAAAPASQAATVLQREAAALRRWVHCGGTPGPWRQQLAGQQQQWLARQPGAAAELQCLRRLSFGPRRAKDVMEGVAHKNKNSGWYYLATAVAMVGMTYAAVPLYRMFCQATGYGGTVQEGKSVEDKIRRWEENPDAELQRKAAAREITVYFNSDVADGMPWKFVPTQRSVKLHPGQSTLAFYTAENKADTSITGVSTYNVAPQQAGQYFNKIQCFCFEEQKLRPHEKIDMPVFFYIDPEFATDPKMNGINIITLSYTFFKVAEEEYSEEEEGAAVPAAAVAALPAAAAAQ
ncbi:hypothetical protein COHA_006080 [Chlorella ohadii]|uniref:Uncharacterized protein n=1 Tax=Chlorella ohadii TaxID=2649997 RepID=A0AAD5DPU8_9CHLO|nr:hypothetical protein COHA_006080 [Chlorella ohadii]